MLHFTGKVWVSWPFWLLLVSACSLLPPKPEAPRVSLAGVQMLQAELLEQRYGLKLRVQNPNDFPLRIRGVDFHLELNREPFADGVSNIPVEVPAYGEGMLQVEVSSSLWSLAKQLQGFGAGSQDVLHYRLHGRMSVQGYALAVPFSSEGELSLGTNGAGARK